MTPAEIKEARQSLRLGQAEMATLLGYDRRQSVSDIERGVMAAGPAVQRLLQAYLDGYRPPDWPK